ncbi:MAG: hypothetical protein RDU20_01640 [Desulfomonilaceae bacterium]|nr:hypothetical protein [Desulfomonilaceae bacterium]
MQHQDAKTVFAAWVDYREKPQVEVDFTGRSIPAAFTGAAAQSEEARP